MYTEPPLITRLAPVMNCASDEAKNAIPFATSKGSFALFNGILFTTMALNIFKSSSGRIVLSLAVSVNPGLGKCKLLYECHV